MDNPLTKCGSEVYQPNEPINLCYDTFWTGGGVHARPVQYLYGADGLTLVPHVPPASANWSSSTRCDSASVQFPRFKGIKYYAVVSGKLAPGGKRHRSGTLGAGDCVLLTGGRACCLTSDPSLPATDAGLQVGESAQRRHRYAQRRRR